MTTQRQNRRNKSRRKNKNQENNSQTIPQLPQQKITNPYPPICPLDEQQLQDIHLASLEILQRFGIEVMSKNARAILKKIGAKVDEETQIVRLDNEIVTEYIQYAPSQFTMTPRNPKNSIHVGGNTINFSMVSGPPSVHDIINGRRPANFNDFQNFTKLGQYFNAISMFGNQTMPPIDLPANTRHLDTYLFTLINSDKFFNSTPIGIARAMDAVHMNSIACQISIDDMHKAPPTATNININSPRKLDDSLADAAIEYAKIGLPVVITPFTLMGAMTPVTLAAALAQQNAEALFAIVMLQAVKKGAPCVYGAFTSNVDLRSGAPAFGTPENALANLAAGQLARLYNLPYRTSSSNAATSADAQATYETMMSLTTAILGGGNLIYHATGWLEGGLLASYEKLIIDVEIIQHIIGLLKPIDTSKDALAIDTIGEIPAGGHFFGCQHTMQKYKSAFYQPFLSNWQNYETWQENGEKNATQRACNIWQKALKEFTPPHIEPHIAEQLQEYVAKRKIYIGNNEP